MRSDRLKVIYVGLGLILEYEWRYGGLRMIFFIFYFMVLVDFGWIKKKKK